MTDLVVIVPSRGRPHTVAEMAEAFERTCTADTRLWFAVDDDDPAVEEYHSAAPQGVHVVTSDNRSMVDALNRAALFLSGDDPKRRRALGFMGDDHRPRTKGWDRAYLDALAARPGIAYCDDLFQGERLPTQCAMSTEVVRALGHMAPPALTHLYVDNYWLDLGHAANCLTYLPDVVIEHVHPVAGKAQMDEGYARVNAPAMYHRDAAAYGAYMAENGARDIAAVQAVIAGVTA
jgi:hypothetical protein